MAWKKPVVWLPLLDVLAACQPAATPMQAVTTRAADLVGRGEYLIRTAGCNDCHTAGYGELGGKVDRARWLTGSPLGYSARRGTT